MPSGQSDTEPDDFIKSRGKTQVLYNKKQVEITDDQGTRLMWTYDYVVIDGKITKSKVFEAIRKANAESDTSTVTPKNIANQMMNSEDALKSSAITGITYAQLDTYIDNNVTDLASAKVYLKKLSKIVLAHIKIDDLD